LNRLAVAAILGVIAALSYVTLSYLWMDDLNLNGQAPLIAVETVSWATSAALLWDLTRLSDDDLGKLKSERVSLAIGLILVLIYLPISVVSSFIGLHKATAIAELQQSTGEIPAENWLYGTWGINDDCTALVTIRPGSKPRSLDITAGGEHHPRQIEGISTERVVKTDRGEFQLRDDGTVTSTEQGWGNLRLSPCP
jgi:hypothetical protein